MEEKIKLVTEYLKNKGIPLGAFYAITFYAGSVVLQGEKKSEIIKLLNIKLEANEAGYLAGEIELSEYFIRIVLTQPL